MLGSALGVGVGSGVGDGGMSSMGPPEIGEGRGEGVVRVSVSRRVCVSAEGVGEGGLALRGESS